MAMLRVLLVILLALPAGLTLDARAKAVAQTIAQAIGPSGGPWSAPYGRGGPPPGPYAPYETPPAGGGLDGEAAARMLRARGFSDVSVLRQRGPTILLEANGPRGERVRVVVDAASGAISGMKVIGFGDRRY
ncbi:hypothetical protein LGR54_19650 [Ancylobacter sp. Lp-2]|uniref:hypothetical protein n=1 Tax=Ancylobacter sp. Lp-2 TaxID=2881339 RepID=UPI001E2DC3D2|nr:hypothetical protein [Ancylobacter sp. Lp-2]MCB4770832.1 hypothetical protein [Ancylobacter sp. Lp-2]